MKTSKIIRFHQTGGPEVLQIDVCSNTEPADHEVRLNIEAFGLNRAECMLRQGVYAFNPIFPCRLGGEGSGTIAAVGSEVRNVSIGDRAAVIPFAVASLVPPSPGIAIPWLGASGWLHMYSRAWAQTPC